MALPRAAHHITCVRTNSIRRRSWFRRPTGEMSGSLLRTCRRRRRVRCRWRKEKVEPARDPDEIRERVRLHLLHHLATMGLDRGFGHAELSADLLVQPAGHD